MPFMHCKVNSTRHFDLGQSGGDGSTHQTRDSKRFQRLYILSGGYNAETTDLDLLEAKAT
jgi:hypothetical protein